MLCLTRRMGRAWCAPACHPARPASGHALPAPYNPSLRSLGSCPQVLAGRELLPEVSLPETHARFLVEQAARLGCQGQRAEISAARVARAAAALRQARGWGGWCGFPQSPDPTFPERQTQNPTSCVRGSGRGRGGNLFGPALTFEASTRKLQRESLLLLWASRPPVCRGSTRVEASDLQTAVQLAILPRATVLQAAPPRPPPPPPPSADRQSEDEEQQEEQQQREQAAADQPLPPAEFAVGVQEVALDPSGEGGTAVY